MPIIQCPEEHTHTVGTTRFTRLAAPSTGSRESSVWRVEIPPGPQPEPHELTREEVIVVISGTACAALDGSVDEVGPGGAIVVPADTPFSLTTAGPEPLVALACLPVGGQAHFNPDEPFTPPWAE